MHHLVGAPSGLRRSSTGVTMSRWPPHCLTGISGLAPTHYNVKTSSDILGDDVVVVEVYLLAFVRMPVLLDAGLLTQTLCLALQKHGTVCFWKAEGCLSCDSESDNRLHVFRPCIKISGPVSAFLFTQRQVYSAIQDVGYSSVRSQ